MHEIVTVYASHILLPPFIVLVVKLELATYAIGAGQNVLSLHYATTSRRLLVNFR